MSAESVQDEAFVSLVTNNSYASGALVLGYSLRRVNTTRKLVLLVAKEVLEPTRERLGRVWDHLEIVDLLDSEDTTNLALLTRPELGITFTKIHCWNLTQYRKCVFLDADTLVIQNCDELFERDELSAVPDIGWPDCFNSGVFVFEPSRATYEALLECAVQNGSFDGGDQGLLNSFFSNWRTADISRHLSFIYNMNSNASYTYAPAFQQFGRDVKIVHFIGPIKPWNHTYNSVNGNVNTLSGSRGYVPHERTFLQLWWDIYVTFVQPEMRQCHDDQAGDSAASEHLHPVTNNPPVHCFEQTSHIQPPPSPPQHFHHEPFIPPPEHFCHPPPPPSPPQHFHHEPPTHPSEHSYHQPAPPSFQHHHIPNPHHYEPPPQHQEAPPSHDASPPPHSMSQHSCPVDTEQAYSGHQEEFTHADTLADEVASIHIAEEGEEVDPVTLDARHRQAWENGEVDYRGRDQFTFILARIEESIGNFLRDPRDVPMFLA
ncbi:glycogenin-1-like [Acropora millepora]|uniref:glycogenin-1-like n=1 Tax=Acropora millepora TaxID=45264 RepID=UPI001CF1AF47|nr:glycogenin-1-like [Acropora millepora]